MAMNPFGIDPEEMSRKALLSQMGGKPPIVDVAPRTGAPESDFRAQPAVIEPKTAAIQEQPYTAKGPAMGLEGFDAGKLANAEHQTPKYVFARAAQGLGLDDRDELMRRLKADPNGYFKNATWSGSKGDILDIGEGAAPIFEGNTKFDVVRGAGVGGQGWHWEVPGGGGAPVQVPNGGGQGALMNADGLPVGDALQSLTEPSTWRTLLSRLEGITGAPSTDRQALLSLLQ